MCLILNPISLSKNWFAFMQPLQNCPPILGRVYATPAKSSPSSGACLCNPCKIFPQFWGGFMQPLQNVPPILRHDFATPAKLSPNSEAWFCNPCKGVPRIWGNVFNLIVTSFLFLGRASLDGDCSHDGGDDGCDNLENLPHCWPLDFHNAEWCVFNCFSVRVFLSLFLSPLVLCLFLNTIQRYKIFLNYANIL